MQQKCHLSGLQGPFEGRHLAETFGGGSGKFSCWEGGHRVPALAYWPGTIQPGTPQALVAHPVALASSVSGGCQDPCSPVACGCYNLRAWPLLLCRRELGAEQHPGRVPYLPVPRRSPTALRPQL